MGEKEVPPVVIGPWLMAWIGVKSSAPWTMRFDCSTTASFEPFEPKSAGPISADAAASAIVFKSCAVDRVTKTDKMYVIQRTACQPELGIYEEWLWKRAPRLQHLNSFRSDGHSSRASWLAIYTEKAVISHTKSCHPHARLHRKANRQGRARIIIVNACFHKESEIAWKWGVSHSWRSLGN
jgi:hypothetical protein